MHYYDYEFLDALDEVPGPPWSRPRQGHLRLFRRPEKGLLEQAVAEAETLIGGWMRPIWGSGWSMSRRRGAPSMAPARTPTNDQGCGSAWPAAMQPSPANELTSLVVVTDLMESYTGP
jgi:hypothetical protein